MRTHLLLLLLVLIASASSAQSTPQPVNQPSWVLVNDSIVGELTLTRGQRQMLHDTELRYQADLDDLFAQEDDLEEAEFKHRTATLYKSREREIQLILNDEQYAQWVILRKTRAKASRPDQ